MESNRKTILTEHQLNNCSKKELISLCKVLMEQNQEINKKLDNLMEQIKLANHYRFGSSSEKDTYYEQTDLFFNEVEATADITKPEPEFEEIVPKPYKRKKQKGKREDDLSKFPVVTIEHKLSEEQCQCECNNQMHVVTTESTKLLKFIPAHFEVEEHIVYVYGCHKCDRMIRADKPDTLLRGSIATPSLVAAIMNGKYVNAVPLARQEAEFERYDINLSRQTMSNWMLRCSEEYLSLLYDELKNFLLSCKVIQADETRIQVLNEEGRKATDQSWMWVYRSGEMCNAPPVILFNYETSRSGYHPKQFLEGYSGFLTSDGYSAYHKLPDEIIVSGCFVHARRKFHDCLKVLPKNQHKGTTADQAIKRIALLYKIEAFLKDKPAKERYEERLKQSKPVLDAYFEWLKTLAGGVDTSSLIGKAINYSLNQKEYLENYLLDGNIAIDNSATERAIKPFAVGRKNFLFANTPNGAAASAIIYSIVETAKTNGLRPYDYLLHVLTEIPKHYKGTSHKFLKDLLPWSDKLPDNCKSKKSK
ncbi:MAG: IS66 family transposase [Firmicutes bacterium]|nr:IS66 family transposase [Bacillota bacterium]